MKSIKTAVILAAGLGLRLRDVFTGQPKGLLAIEETPLVERSIQQLIAHGINEIIIVTGYLAEEYEVLAALYAPFVQTVHNPYYADSGSMYSLYCARHLVQESFLLLESDLLYEGRALSTLLDSPLESAILISGFTQSGDEIYIELRDDLFYHMSKDRSELNTVVGELVGISKISPLLFTQMVSASEQFFQNSRHWHYEEGCLNHIAKEASIPVCIVPDLIWTEIDDATHLQRAQKIVWPQIRQIENEALSGKTISGRALQL